MSKMEKEKTLGIIGVILLLTGIICLGAVMVFVIFTYIITFEWDAFYTWLILIGLPCFVVGVVLVNKYLKT